MKNGMKKKGLYLGANVFSTKVLIGDAIFTSPTGDGTASFRVHPSHAKVQSFAGQKKYLHYSVIFKMLSVRLPRPPALQSSAVLTDLS